MIIPIDDKHRLATDRYQWMIQEMKSYKDSKTGEQVKNWEGIKFYPTIEGAVNGLAQLKLRLSEAETLTDALAEVKNIAKLLKTALTLQFKVEER